MNYRREIDGLRAVAVLPVILFHAGFQSFGGGFVGVDVFFVISGYLITSIILAEMQAGTFSLISFYERRARRILPALFFVLAASIPFAWLWLLPADLKGFSQSLVAVPTFTANLLFWHQSGYFDTAAELKPLLHTWSLSVEEQFYLLFPLLILATWRLGKSRIVLILAVVAVISLATAHWVVSYYPSAAFFLLPTRAWELAIGALAAFHYRRVDLGKNSRLAAELLSGAGLALILYAVFAFSKSTPFPSLYALTPTIGTASIILFATPNTVVGTLLGHKAFVGVGLVSYSAYLWHQPLFALARHKTVVSPGYGLMLALAIASLVLALFTWRYVEQPFRRKGIIGKKSVVVVSVLCSGVFVVVGVVGNSTDGFVNYYTEKRLPSEQAELFRVMNKHVGGDIYKEMVDDGGCRFWSKNIDSYFVQRFESCVALNGKAVVVLGDSHAMNLYNIVAKSELNRFVVGVSQGGCRPHNNHDYCHYDGFDRFAALHAKNIDFVIYHQSGSYLGGEITQNVIRYLGRLDNVVKVAWVGSHSEARVNYKAPSIQRRELFIPEEYIRYFDQVDIETREKVLLARASFRYISFSDIFRIDRDFLLVDSCITFRDDDHFSRCGEDLIARNMNRDILSGRNK